MYILTHSTSLTWTSILVIPTSNFVDPLQFYDINEHFDAYLYLCLERMSARWIPFALLTNEMIDIYIYINIYQNPTKDKKEGNFFFFWLEIESLEKRPAQEKKKKIGEESDIRERDWTQSMVFKSHESNFVVILS